MAQIGIAFIEEVRASDAYPEQLWPFHEKRVELLFTVGIDFFYASLLLFVNGSREESDVIEGVRMVDGEIE